MASSRTMRKSPRNASPMTNTVQSTSTNNSDTNLKRDRSDTGEDWIEPSLRTPAPSFEDHRGGERHGVLEQMAPLGTMPNTQKVKLRLRQFESKQWESSPGTQTKNRNGGVNVGGPASGGKESEGTERLRQTETLKGDEHPGKRISLREKDDDTEYTPKQTTRTTSKPAVPNSSNSKPNSSTPQGREHLRTIVEHAVQRAKEIGNELVGLAIQKVFHDSLNHKEVAEVLDAVLNQQATSDQAKEFQAYIKIARRQIKAERLQQQQSQVQADLVPTDPVPSGNQRTSKPPANKSPAKRTRRSASRHATADSNNNNNVPAPNKTRSRANGNMNGEEDHRPSKRMKRSRSVSSDSSALSSTHSLEMEQPETAGSNELPSLRSRSSGNKGSTNRRQANTIVSGVNNKSQLQDDAEDDDLASKKAKLKLSFNDYKVNESSIRSDPVPAPPKEDKRTFPKLPTGLSTSRNNFTDDYDDVVSPASSLAGDFLVPPPPGAMRVSRSRGATPNALGRPKNAARRYARVKNSPNKKKTGAAAGGRESSRLREREKDTAVPVSESDSEEGDNNDYCTACDLSGELLCCDGCPRSFHLQCLDPPLSSPPEGEWLCYHCESRRREPQPRPPRGIFALLVDDFRKQNPKQFSLPDDIRNYFEGMKTGEDGEYEEVSHLKPKQRMLGSHDDPDKDNLKIKDSKGAVVLCFRCGKSALGRREIIACDYCALKWHLDCLDPPLANPPVRDPHNSNRAKNSWMCPAHAPSEIQTVGIGGEATHKIRKPRNAKVVESSLRRGVKNNGVIEIENDPSDDEAACDGEEGVIYRVTERSIKLDFIDRVHKLREDAARRRASALEATRKKANDEAQAQRTANIAFNTRKFIEKDAAISLVQFAGAEANLDLGANEMQHMINALIANAPDETIALIKANEEEADKTKSAIEVKASSMATPPRSDGQDRTLTLKQKQSYMLLLDLIQKRLKEAENAE